MSCLITRLLKNSTTFYDAQYSYDTIGRMTQKIETIEGVTDTYDYSYDTAERLTEVRKKGTVFSTYTYFANGNRLSATDSLGDVVGTYDGAGSPAHIWRQLVFPTQPVVNC